MIIHKNYTTPFRRFVLFVTISLFFACSPARHVSNIKGEQLPVTAAYTPVQQIEDYVKPYREHIKKDLDSVLAYCPETMDKAKTINGWQTTIGNFEAETVLAAADKLMLQRYNKHADVCMLNHGGIRSIIPKGNVTAGTAYAIMPFENALVVIALKGEQITELAQYVLKEKKPHPLSGIEIHIDANGNLKNIKVQGQPLDANKTYYVATNDYLANGGDSMSFFTKGTARYDMDYKLRNVFIDYFKAVDTLPIITTERIIQDK